MTENTIHERLVQAWKACEFGVKTEVFKHYAQQTISYILKKDTYQDEEKMLAIITCIKQESEKVKNDVVKMNTEISKI